VVEIQWDIRREGRAWRGDEARERFSLTPEKFEMVKGQLFWGDEQRVTLLALLLENVGQIRALTNLVKSAKLGSWPIASSPVWCASL